MPIKDQLLACTRCTGFIELQLEQMKLCARTVHCSDVFVQISSWSSNGRQMQAYIYC